MIKHGEVDECDFCEGKYIKGNGFTKIWLFEEDKFEDYPDWKYIGFEGIEDYRGISHAVLGFCSTECFEKYVKKYSTSPP